MRARDGGVGARETIASRGGFVAELQQTSAARQERVDQPERIEPALAAQIDVNDWVQTGKHSH